MSPLLVAALVLVLVVSIALAGLHWWFTAERIELDQTPADFDLPAEAVSIPGLKGKPLFGWWIAAKDADTTVIILHGWGSSSTQLLPLATPFHLAGYNVLLFDAHNHGRSSKHGVSSLPLFADALHEVIHWLRKTKGGQTKQLVLTGHSVGAGAVLLEASRRQDIYAVISLSAFAHPRLLMTRYLSNYHIPRFLIHLILNYVQWIIGHRFDDIAPMHTAAKSHAPVLLVHGTADTTVPPGDIELIHQHCPGCQRLLIAGAKHDSIEKVEEHGHELVAFLEQCREKH